jgi:hypothetical protein
MDCSDEQHGAPVTAHTAQIEEVTRALRFRYVGNGRYAFLRGMDGCRDNPAGKIKCPTPQSPEKFGLFFGSGLHWNQCREVSVLFRTFHAIAMKKSTKALPITRGLFRSSSL